MESSNESQDVLDTLGEHAEVANPAMLDNFKSALHPSALVHGLIAGVAANKLINLVDKDKKLNPFVRTGLEGATSGLASGLISAGLGVGEASLAVEAGAGFAGYETQKYGKQGLSWIEDKISSGSSKTELGGDIADVGADAAAGAVSGAILGGPVGAAVGGSIGALVGVGTSLFHHFF